MASSGGDTGYEIEQSLRFDSGDTAHLQRTPSSAGNRRTFTLSAWIKTTDGFPADPIFCCGTGTNDASTTYIAFYQGKMQFQGYNTNYRVTNRVFRDTAAWYHFIWAVDTTQSTADNRIRLYVNGVEETSFGTKNNPSQNYEFIINSINEHQLGDEGGQTGGYPPFDGHMAEVNFIDGAQLTPSSFGETDSITGQWIPKEPDGLTYGTNGFYLKCSGETAKYSPYFDTDVQGIYLSHTDAIDSLGTKNFTTEGWIYPEHDGASDSYDCIWSCGAPQQIYWHKESQMVRVFYQSGGSYCYNNVTSTANVKAGEWCHFAVVRNGTSMTIYTHGVGGTAATSSASINASSTNAYIGTFQGESGGSQFWGSVYGLRHTIGTARYTSNFTPPTADLTDDIAWNSSSNTGVGFLQVTNSNGTITDAGEGHTITKVGSWSSRYFSPTVTDVGNDSSGNGNDFVPTNLLPSDVMLDSPTNNFPTLNFLDNGNNSTLSRGALKATFSGWSDTFGTFQVPFTGKWYWELAATTNGNLYFGLWTTNYTDTDAGQDYGTGKQVLGTGGITGGSSGAYFGSAVSNGDIIGMAVDCDNGKIWWSRNGTYGSSGNPATGANQALTFTATDVYKIIVAGASGNVSDINFGQNGTFTGTKTAQGNADAGGVGNFYYAPPSGFKALCTKNLPNPAVKKSSDHFNAVVYTGTGSTRSVTGVGHKPGMLWIKAYSTTDDHRVQDEVRGSTKQLDINNTDAEYTAADGITSFDSDGFTIGADSSNQFNVSGTSSVAFSWKGAGSGSANNSGDINATVSANPTAGFSIIKWTADGSNNNTVAHGLGIKPSVVWYKKIADGGHSWYVLTDAYDGSQDYLRLSNADFISVSAGGYGWQTSSTISNWTWNSGHEMMAYAFAEIEGFSQFGAYNSNAVVNGPFIHTGFTPKFFMARHINNPTSEWWYQYDTARDDANPIPAMLFPNANSAQYTSGSNVIDIVSNGIKLRANNGTINGYTSANNYFYMAFAESPFKYANAR
jgi:hypothetical protein